MIIVKNSLEPIANDIFFEKILKIIKNDSFHTFPIFGGTFILHALWRHGTLPRFDCPIKFYAYIDQSPFQMWNRPWTQNVEKLVQGSLESVGLLFVNYFDTFFVMLTFVQIQTSLNVLELFTTIHDQSINIKGWYLITVA